MAHLWLTNEDNTVSVGDFIANTGKVVRAMKDRYYRLTKVQVGHSHDGAALTEVATTRSRAWVVNQFARYWNGTRQTGHVFETSHRS